MHDPLSAIAQLAVRDVPRRRLRPSDFDAVDLDDGRAVHARTRRRLDSGGAPRVDAATGAPTDVDAIVTLMRKRLCVRESDAEDVHATHGGLFALLPDELVIEVMFFCGPRSLGRLACASAHLADLAADNSLWRRLYARAFPLCTRSGLACLADVVDAWHFASDDGAIDGLDHGPAAGDMCLRDQQGVHGDAEPCCDGPAYGSERESGDRRNTRSKCASRSALLSRWWNLRCARLTRLAADRVTGAGAPLAHSGCRHVPPSLVRARGYRWAYAMAGLMPLVRKTRHEAGHAHRIVHRGPPDGLAVQCEMCLAPGRPCGLVTWRWGRFNDCFLSGLGTEATSLASSLDQDAYDHQDYNHRQGGGDHRNHNNNNNNNNMTGAPLTGATTVVAGFWADGMPHATHVRRDAHGEIVIGTVAPDHFEPSRPEPMDEDRTTVTHDRNSDRDDGDDSDGDGGIYIAGAFAHTPSVIYYACDDPSHGAWCYEGERLGGRRHGYGTLSCEASPAPTYEGDWRDDAWHGRGTLKARDGIKTFEGRFVRGRPRGRGVLYLRDGLRVEASWHALPDGTVAPRHIGHVVYANGDRVLCDWGRSKAGSDVCGSVTVRGFRFADDDNALAPAHKKARDDSGVAVFAGREVGTEWGPWPTECADEPTIVDVRATMGLLPAQSGGDPGFCRQAWRVMLPVVFWPPTRHPLEPLFARYVDEDRIGWRGCRTRAPRPADPPDPCAL
ncbi:Morn repeat protein [Pandoravirus kuranda]|uniref:Morn repeat protein n=1 Tax=Pandoravirus kuranda TaxID=3019033 RepID=A0AA95J6L0_9VIRU|nr:Morn repeat protein [Pandoravirus kuranda]